MERNYLFIVERTSPGVSMVHGSETKIDRTFATTTANNLDEFCNRLGDSLEGFKSAPEFDTELEKAINRLQTQNYAIMNLTLFGCESVELTIVAPKFD